MAQDERYISCVIFFVSGCHEYYVSVSRGQAFGIYGLQAYSHLMCTPLGKNLHIKYLKCILLTWYHLRDYIECCYCALFLKTDEQLRYYVC